MNINTIENKDCIEYTKSLPDECVDLIVTSPPYFVGKDYNEGADFNNKDNIDEEWERFSDWLVDVFKECIRVLKPAGKLAINIDDRHITTKSKRKNVTCPTHAKLVFSLYKDLDYKEMFLWRKIRAKHASGGANRMLGSYGQHGSPGEIPIVQEVEYIPIFRKIGKRDVSTDLRKESALTSDEFGVYGMQIWDVNPERDRVHPAPFPVEIPYRLIKMFTFKGDLIYDPFMGSGTTAIASIITGRNYIGCDLSEDFCKISENRIKYFSRFGNDKLFLSTGKIKKKKKIKFKDIF